NYRYHGYQFDADIFSALYNALSMLGVMPVRKSIPTDIDQVELSDRQSLIVKKVFAQKKFSPRQLTFSNNGEMMASICSDYVVRVWSLKNLTAYPINVVALRTARALRFSTSGALVVSLSDGWDIEIPIEFRVMVEILCKRIERGLTTEEWETYVAPDLPIERPCITVNKK
ncbi:MAG: hypothetical protein ACKOE6_03380, partial [Flammeovirgaceae bacterium]